MSSALILIDLIEDIMGQHGLINSSYQQATERNLIAHCNKAIKHARRQQIPIIWVRVGFADDYQDMPRFSPLFTKAKQFGALRLNNAGCRWVEGLDRQPQDENMTKKAVSAFVGTSLLEWLQSRGHDHLLLGGVSSLMAIQSTTRQAHDLGFKVTVLEDLCAAPTLQLHQQSMQALLPLAKVITSRSWLR